MCLKTNLGYLKIQAHFGRAFLVSCGFTSPPFFCRCCYYFRLNILKTSAKVRGHLLVWDFTNLISSPSLLTIHSIRLDGCLEIVQSEIFFFNESCFRYLVVKTTAFLPRTILKLYEKFKTIRQPFCGLGGSC